MKKLLIHFGGVSLVCIASIVGYGFWYAAVEAKSVAAAHLESQIVAKTETASRIASARASLAEIAGDEASIRSYFVPETGIVAFINNLEEQGRKQKASVSVLSVSTSNVGARPALIFTLTIKGTFDTVMRTVGAIEYAPYALSISALSIGHDDETDWHANLTLLVGSVSVKTATSTPIL